MQNNSKQLNAWYEVEVEEGGTKMFVFNYFLLCTRGQAAAAGNTQSSRWKCTEQHSRMINTHLQRSHHENAKYTQTIGNAQNNNLGCSTSSSQISDAHNTTTLSDNQHLHLQRSQWDSHSSPHEWISISTLKNTKILSSIAVGCAAKYPKRLIECVMFGKVLNWLALSLQ